MNNIFNFDDMASGAARAKAQITRLFAKYRTDAASVEIDPKLRRSSGITYRDVHVAMSDNQTVTFKVKQTGDIFQVLVQGRAVPIKSQNDQAAAIREIVDVLNARRARVQKALAAAKVPMRRGASVSVKMQVNQLKAKIAGLDAMIEDANMELAEMAGPEATPLAEAAAEPVAEAVVMPAAEANPVPPVAEVPTVPAPSAVEASTNPGGLSDAEMVVLMLAGGYKPAYRKQNARNDTGMSAQLYDATVEKLNASGMYLKRSALTPAGRALIDPQNNGMLSEHLRAFRGKFETPVVQPTAEEAAAALPTAPIDDGMAWLRGIIDGTTDISADLKGYRDRIRAAQAVEATAELAGQAAKVLAKVALAKAQAVASLDDTTLDAAARATAPAKPKAGKAPDGWHVVTMAEREHNEKDAAFYKDFGGGEYVKYDMTIAFDGEHYIPIHGTVKMSPTKTASAAADALSKYWHDLPDSGKKVAKGS